MVLSLLGLAVVGILGIRFLYFSNFNKIAEMGQRPMPTATLPAVALVEDPTATATVEATPTRWPTPIILEREVVREIPVEVTREVSVYREVPIEVTRVVTQLVEVTPFAMATVTPIPLAKGQVKICASVEGATGLYIGGYGVVSGGCQIFTFGVGQTSIQVQINR